MLSKKGGIGRGGRVLARGAIHMAAASAGYRTALVGTGWTISHISTNGCRNHSSPLISWSTISDTVGIFQSEGAFAGQRALTIESLLMSGCGQGN